MLVMEELRQLSQARTDRLEGELFFRALGLESDRAEIARKLGGGRRRDRDALDPCELAAEPAVEPHDIRMRDRKYLQVFAPFRLRESRQTLPSGTIPGCVRETSRGSFS